MYKQILIVVDGRPVSREAIAEGVATAAIHGARVTFVHVLPEYPVTVSDMPSFAVIPRREFSQAARMKALKLLTAAKLAAEKAGVQAAIATVRGGNDDARTIAEAASARQCDLIVVATEGRNALLRLLTGSIVPGIITCSLVPVLVVKTAERVKPRVSENATVREATRKVRKQAAHASV